MRQLIAYIPVLHRGYLDLVKKWVRAGGGRVTVLSSELVGELGGPVKKDLHALVNEEIAVSLNAVIQAWMIEEEVKPERWEVTTATNLEVEREELKKIDQKDELWLPDEEIMRRLVQEMGWREEQIKWQGVFLRWERKKALASREPEVVAEISEDEFDAKMMKLAVKEGELSADWWRRVGGVLVREGQVLAMAHNRHLPDEQQPNVEGDIRGQFHRGEHWELGTAIHAEQDLVARAAAEGMAVEGAELYVTDFPCPMCAKLIARAGIKTVYFQRGYAVSDGERVLRTAGVKIVRVQG